MIKNISFFKQLLWAPFHLSTVTTRLTLVLQVISCSHICYLTSSRDRHLQGSLRFPPWLTPGAPLIWLTSTVKRATTNRRRTPRASWLTFSSAALWLSDLKVCCPNDHHIKCYVAAVGHLLLHWHAGTGVTTYSLHPGVVQTDLWRHLSASQQVLMKIAKPFTKNSVQGAQTSIYCAVEPSLEKETGGYYRWLIIWLHPLFIYSVKRIINHQWMQNNYYLFKSGLSALCSTCLLLVFSPPATALLPAAQQRERTMILHKSCGSWAAKCCP